MANRLRNRRRQQVDDDDEAEEGVGAPLMQDDMTDPDLKLSKKDIQKMQKRQEKQRQQDALRQQKEE